MTRLMMIAAASLLTLVLTGCGDNKDTKPEATVPTNSQPADATQPATSPNTNNSTTDHKPANQ